MNRRHLMIVLFGLAPLSSTLCFAGNPHDNQQHKGKKKRHNDRDTRYFRKQDYGIIERYYSGPRNLPPGLRKKYYRTGTLPPGWQKKLQPFPPELVRELPPPPTNCERGYIDGVAVVYDRTTRVILDSIVLIGAVTGH
jgi:hypothetical protein